MCCDDGDEDATSDQAKVALAEVEAGDSAVVDCLEVAVEVVLGCLVAVVEPVAVSVAELGD